MRFSRRALQVTGAGVGLLVLGVLVGEVSGWPFLRQPLQNAATRAAGVPVVLEGRFRTHLLWRPRMEVEHLNIAPGGNVAVPHLVDARNVELAWGWGDVWRWRQDDETLYLRRLVAGTIDAHLVRGADRRASWQLGQPKEPKADKTDPLEGVPRFGTLVVKQGVVIVDDAPTDTKLRIDIAGREGEKLPDGTPVGYEAAIKGRWRALPMQLQVHAGGSLPLLENDAEAPLVPLRVQGQAGAATLMFQGSAGALLGARRIDGDLDFRGPSLAKVGEPMGVTLPNTPPFELRGRLAHNAGLWHLRADRAHIGESRLRGEFDYDSRPQTPKLTGKLMGARLSLADLGPAVGKPAAGKEAAAARPPAGRVLPNRKFNIPSLRAMDANVQVAIDELNFGTDEVSALRQVRTQLVLNAGVLKLQGLQAVVAGGSFGGDSQLDGNANPARWQADMRFDTVDIAAWLPGLKSKAGDTRESQGASNAELKNRREQARKGGDQPVKSYVTGSLSGQIKVAGAGRSTADILASLDGTARMVLRDGTLSHLATEAAGIDVAQALGVLMRGDQPLPLNCARLDLVVNDGIVKPRVALLDNKDTTIRFEGQVNLRDETLAVRAVAKPKDFSPLSLRTPVTVNGTLAKPEIGVDGRGLAGRAAAAVALGAAVGPLAALVPFMDPGNKEENPCSGAAPQNGDKAANAPAKDANKAPTVKTANGK
ncbi:MAG TPA: AsmA family protein [Rubrivivax sp.]|nr:AsmA family protein [Rubrivivax sp.]